MRFRSWVPDAPGRHRTARVVVQAIWVQGASKCPPSTGRAATDLYCHLPHTPQAPQQARAEITAFLADRSTSDTLDIAVLLTSELVTNGITHAQAPLYLHAAINPELIHIDLTDNSPAALPCRQYPDRHEQHGRGLALVDELSSRWGNTSTDHAKTVWFEIDTDADTTTGTFSGFW